MVLHQASSLPAPSVRKTSSSWLHQWICLSLLVVGSQGLSENCNGIILPYHDPLLEVAYKALDLTKIEKCDTNETLPEMNCEHNFDQISPDRFQFLRHACEYRGGKVATLDYAIDCTGATIDVSGDFWCIDKECSVSDIQLEVLDFSWMNPEFGLDFYFANGARYNDCVVSNRQNLKILPFLPNPDITPVIDSQCTEAQSLSMTASSKQLAEAHRTYVDNLNEDDHCQRIDDPFSNMDTLFCRVDFTDLPESELYQNACLETGRTIRLVDFQTTICKGTDPVRDPPALVLQTIGFPWCASFECTQGQLSDYLGPNVDDGLTVLDQYFGSCLDLGGSEPRFVQSTVGARCFDLEGALRRDDCRCHESCQTCVGPHDFDCLTCPDNDDPSYIINPGHQSGVCGSAKTNSEQYPCIAEELIVDECFKVNSKSCGSDSLVSTLWFNSAPQNECFDSMLSCSSLEQDGCVACNSALVKYSQCIGEYRNEETMMQDFVYPRGRCFEEFCNDGDDKKRIWPMVLGGIAGAVAVLTCFSFVGWVLFSKVDTGDLTMPQTKPSREKSTRRSVGSAESFRQDDDEYGLDSERRSQHSRFVDEQDCVEDVSDLDSDDESYREMKRLAHPRRVPRPASSRRSRR